MTPRQRAEEQAKRCAAELRFRRPAEPFYWHEHNCDAAIICEQLHLPQLFAIVEAAEKVLDDYEGYFVDWSKLNKESPDYDPKYKPEFPCFAVDLRETLTNYNAALRRKKEK